MQGSHLVLAATTYLLCPKYIDNVLLNCPVPAGGENQLLLPVHGAVSYQYVCTYTTAQQLAHAWSWTIKHDLRWVSIWKGSPFPRLVAAGEPDTSADEAVTLQHLHHPCVLLSTQGQQGEACHDQDSHTQLARRTCLAPRAG